MIHVLCYGNQITDNYYSQHTIFHTTTNIKRGSSSNYLVTDKLAGILLLIHGYRILSYGRFETAEGQVDNFHVRYCMIRLYHSCMHVPIIIMAHESTASHTGFRWGMANMQYYREGDFQRVQFSPIIMFNLATNKIKPVKKSYGLSIRKKMHSSIFFSLYLIIMVVSQL